jgi:dipeptidyl aminopeptidase/acylaminoacyl peptidase
MAQVTLEKLLSAPFYYNLVAAPSGDKAVWVKNERGVRNIQIATAPDWIPRNVTNYTDDDGVEMGSFEWLKDASAFFFVRGNAPQVRASQAHNPAHLLEGTAPMIWKLTIADGKMEKIGLGTNPSVSPDGSRLIFSRAGQLWLKNALDMSEAKQLCHVRNGASAPNWSPDGRRFAFASTRGEVVHLGIYDFDKKDYQFIEPGIDRDVSVAWSPDGRQLAHLRQPRGIDLAVFSAPLRELPAWSIRVVDVATMKTRTVFTADAGMGSVYVPHNGRQQLHWSANNRIIFCWEKTGWQQLYSLPAAGGKVTKMTEGAFEIDELYMTADRKFLIYNSNEKDIDRKHIWLAVADEAGGSPAVPPMPLTTGQTIESQLSINDKGQTFFIQTDGRTPSQVACIQDGKLKVLTPLSPDFPKAALVEPEHLVLKAKDGFTFYNQVFYPKNLKKDKSHRALIFVHGGSRRQMLLGYHPGQYYTNAYHLSQYFAAQGYVVVHINFRSGTGYGRDFREALDFGITGASEFRDLEALGEWLKSHPSVAASKMAVWGGSYGGYLTAHALARRSDLFAAGADMHGVHNWNTAIPTFTPEFDSLRFPKIGQLAYQSSPMNYLDGWKSPVLLIHGDDDANVNFIETIQLQKHLRRRQVETELLVIPDEVHSFLRFQSWFTAYSAIIDFFDRKIKP